jgi:DNA-binding transcriptional MerR regulator
LTSPEHSGSFLLVSDADPNDSSAPTYSLGAVSRLTGLSAHVLRAWERRYGAVVPLRTPGGTRRYRESDVARLRKLRAAVMAGHSISEVANASDEELERRLGMAPSLPEPALTPLLDAIDRLDGAEAERLLAGQLAALGPSRFVRGVASPLLREIGDRWAAGSMCIASEHLASTILRSLLGTCLRATTAGQQSAPILFTTLPGEEHELGSLMAAVTTAQAGGHPIFIGSNLPVPEIVHAADSLDAAAVAVGLCHVNGLDVPATLRALRDALPARVEIWIGGPGVDAFPLPPQVQPIADNDQLERKIALLLERGVHA